MSKIWAMFFLSVSLFGVSCQPDYAPKPRGFQRFVFPAKTYKNYNNDCGFSCQIPTYATVLPDFSVNNQKCWVNVFYSPYNATLHLSYNPISSIKQLHKFSEDARVLVYKHTVKADEIFETYIEKDNLNGMVYELSGNTATNFQFYVTDSSKHYLRGALYFNAQTNQDSILPVLNFLKQDIMYMLKTIEWK